MQTFSETPLSLGATRTGLTVSAFDTIIVCKCGHGIGRHTPRGCTHDDGRCACDFDRAAVIDWAIATDHHRRTMQLQLMRMAAAREAQSA